MLNERLAAAQSIYAHLVPAETDLGSALTSMAALLSRLPQARAEAKISSAVGHDVILAVQEACNSIVNAMGKTVEAHAGLAELQKSVGLRAVSFGGGVWKEASLTSPAEVANAA